MRSREDARHLETAFKGDRWPRPEDRSVCVRGGRDVVEEGGLPVARQPIAGRYHRKPDQVGACLSAVMRCA